MFFPDETSNVAANIQKSDDYQHLAPLQRIINYLKNGEDKQCDPYILNTHKLLLEEDLEAIERITTGQAASEAWHEIRRGMMTASNFHRIRSRTKTLKQHPGESPDALLRQLCRVSTNFYTMPASLEWGQKNEKKALKCYKKVAQKLHARFQVAKAGLTVCRENFLLGCSPDGMCFCKCPKQKCPRQWLVEIKCPYAFRYCPAKVAAQNNGCFYSHDKKKWMLDKTHKHYTQVQGLMGIMKCINLDFVVYTSKGVLIVPVNFDQVFFDNLIEDLQYFQENYLFPYFLKVYS